MSDADLRDRMLKLEVRQDATDSHISVAIEKFLEFIATRDDAAKEERILVGRLHSRINEMKDEIHIAFKERDEKTNASFKESSEKISDVRIEMAKMVGAALTLLAVVQLLIAVYIN